MRVRERLGLTGQEKTEIEPDVIDKLLESMKEGLINIRTTEENANLLHKKIAESLIEASENNDAEERDVSMNAIVAYGRWTKKRMLKARFNNSDEVQASKEVRVIIRRAETEEEVEECARFEFPIAEGEVLTGTITDAHLSDNGGIILKDTITTNMSGDQAYVRPYFEMHDVFREQSGQLVPRIHIELAGN